jgi:hypothetical protein
MRATERQRRRSRLCALLISLAFVPNETTGAAETVTVEVDQAKVVRLPDRVATLVVGNPLIADVSVQQGGVMVVTGKGYGSTNVVALDRNGDVVMDKRLQVESPRAGVVTVYRGSERETYDCTPLCERRITLGDAPNYFDQTLNQTIIRTGQAQGSAAPPPAR